MNETLNSLCWNDRLDFVKQLDKQEFVELRKSVFNEEVMIMSRNIKGGFLTLSGVVGIVGMIIAAMQNPATAWVTPPGRMIVSILENGLLIPTVLFLVLFIYGLSILLTEKND